MGSVSVKEWVQNVIKPEEIEKYLNNGKDFLDENFINETLLKSKSQANPKFVRLWRNLWNCSGWSRKKRQLF